MQPTHGDQSQSPFDQGSRTSGVAPEIVFKCLGQARCFGVERRYFLVVRVGFRAKCGSKDEFLRGEADRYESSGEPYERSAMGRRKIPDSFEIDSEMNREPGREGAENDHTVDRSSENTGQQAQLTIIYKGPV